MSLPGHIYVATTIDKSEWADGPWKTEPDRVYWKDLATGLDCFVYRVDRELGTLCGYVGVLSGHPLHRRHYSGLDDFEVHGGLTFSGFFKTPHDVAVLPPCWWFGFDTAHAFDVIPGILKLMGEKSWPGFESEYRDLRYVIAECTSLARQLYGLINAPLTTDKVR